ncbi:aldo/keto reductase [Amycolatopsis sp. CA-126428]|uniref:aldo/keto reductase n=1 Tax=Amycolatopsis sp. CA-126428 TaxID=2073158 RepID=UPI000CD0335D|nr:aldo/keto reductase [Amycolatopsis sp. CA-126428]
MRTRPLGRTGIQVSGFTLGTMMFGPYGNPDPDECVRIVHRALDDGINTIDTADVYGDGESEKILGKALRGSSRRWIVSAVEGSLRRLGVDHVDLYQAHHPAPGTDVEETLGALTDLVRAGKVRAIGHSNLPASDIVEAQWVAERRRLARFRTEQPHYSILNRGIERGILPVCERSGLGVLVWSPLAMGLLAGQAGLPLPHLALAFVTAHPAVTSAIIGPRTPAQLDDLLAGAGTLLDDDLLDHIDEIVNPNFPHHRRCQARSG